MTQTTHARWSDTAPSSAAVMGQSDSTETRTRGAAQMNGLGKQWELRRRPAKNTHHIIFKDRGCR